MDKQTILKRIAESEDEALLKQIEQLLDFAQEDYDFWNDLTEAQKKDIQAGIDDLENGRHKPLDEVLRKYL